MQDASTKFELPKFVCILAGIAGAAACGVQLAIDIWQSILPGMLPEERAIQISQMSLVTIFVIVLGAIGGRWFKRGLWGACIGLYAAAAVCMWVTATNGMDFLSNKTVAVTQAHLKRATAEKDINDIKNKLALEERNERRENLWRTYMSAKGAEKDKVLAEIKAAGQEAVDLKADVDVVQVGIGATISSRFGWKPEAIQEARAVLIPTVTMVLKALLISVAFGCWPTYTPERWKAASPTRLASHTSPESIGKVSYQMACEDMLSMLANGGRAESQRELANRWGVNEAKVSKWLPRMKRDGIPIKFEMNGNRRAIVAAPTYANGNGRVAGNA